MGNNVRDTTTERFTDRFATIILKTLQNSKGAKMLSRSGAFSSLVKLEEIPSNIIAATVDGPGSKLKLAIKLNQLKNTGECLVAHGENDLGAQGAQPLFMLDYIGGSQPEPKIVEAILNSLAVACERRRIPLVGGEVGVLPDTYRDNQYELLGILIGIARYHQLSEISKVKPGDLIYAFPSGGLGNNGYTVARDALARINLSEYAPQLGSTLAEALLQPTRSYAKIAFEALDQGCDIHALANITGGGIPSNLARVLLPNYQAELSVSSISKGIPPIMEIIRTEGNVPWEIMLREFNLGVGYAIVLPQQATSVLKKVASKHGMYAYQIGKVVAGDGQKVCFDEEWQ